MNIKDGDCNILTVNFYRIDESNKNGCLMFYDFENHEFFRFENENIRRT